MPKKLRVMALCILFGTSLGLGMINCQTIKITSSVINENAEKQIEALTHFSEQFVVVPGKVTLIKFPYFGPFQSEALFCNGEELPFFRSIDDDVAVAYVALSYFSRKDNLSCKFQFRVFADENEAHELSIGKLLVGEIDYPKEQLKVDGKRVVLSDQDQKRVLREKKMLDEIFAQKADFPFFIEPFNAPLSSKITSVFGTQRIFNGHVASEHLGTDYRAQIGTDIKATNKGRVVFAGDLFFGGNTVVVDHGLGIFTSYSHLSKILVVVGEMVTKTTKLGASGNTGRVSGRPAGKCVP